MYSSYKVWDAAVDRTKLPRKAKKWAFGSRLSSCEIKRRIRGTQLGPEIRTMYERREAMPYGLFCPKCGCSEVWSTPNKASYPEAWYNFRCLRCGHKVAYIDNSPFIHVLEELAENNAPPPKCKSEAMARRLKNYRWACMTLKEQNKIWGFVDLVAPQAKAELSQKDPSKN